MINLPFTREILRSGYVSTHVNGHHWRGFFGIPLEGGAIAAHPFAPEDRAIMPTIVFTQDMADRIRKTADGFSFSL